MTQMGLLFVINEPPAAMEEETNAWYDTEHISERLGITGFLTAHRYVSAARARRYLALYDLTDVAVLKSAAYMAFVGDKFTPWTKRILARTRVTRIEGVQIYPGDAPAATAARHLILRFPAGSGATDADLVDRFKRCFLGKPGVSQLRVFAGSGDDAGSHIAHVAGTADLESLFDPAAFAGSAPDLIEPYLPY